jgi:protein-glutamine gamma-glutamyltransferase
MNAAVLFRRAAMVQVLLALAAFAVADRSVWFLVVGGVLAVASGSVTEGPRGRHLPNWLVSIGVVVAMGWGVVSLAEQPGLRAATGIVGAVVLVILMLKLYGRKGPSDWRQVLALTVVMIIAAALGSVDLLTGALVIAYAGTAMTSVMLYHLYAGERAADHERRAALAAAGPPSARAAEPIASAPVVSGAHAIRSFRRLLVISGIAGLLVSSVVFLLFPRDAVLGDRWQGRGRQSGFRDEIVLLGNDRLQLSAREVFSVRMLDPQGVAARFVNDLHLRGAVLDVYSMADRRWISSERRAEQFSTTVGSEQRGQFAPFAPEALGERANVWTQEVRMRSLASRFVFSMWLPIAISSPEARTFSLNAQTGVIRDENQDRSGRPWSYSVRVQPFPGQRIVRAVCPASAMGERVGFPVPAVGELAREWLAQANLEGLPTEEQAAEDPDLRYERNRRIARLFTERLQGREFGYTTDLSSFRAISGEDPNVSFLRRYRFGHCEYFASGLAAMCRSVGVESRVVVGFLASEYDDGSQEYVVREANAHAWVEVRTGEWQWSTFDPSPMEALLISQSANRSWLDRFRWVLDPLEFAWQSRVVSFDSGSQAEMADRVGGSVQRAVRAAGEWAQGAADQVNRAFRLGPAGYIWLGLVAVVLGIAVTAVWVLTRRDRRVRQTLGAEKVQARDRVVLGRDAAFYLEALDVLRRHELAKPRWCPPRLHAEEVGRLAGPGVQAAFQRVVDRYYRIRFAGDHPRRSERVADQALVTQLRAALAERYTRA